MWTPVKTHPGSRVVTILQLIHELKYILRGAATNKTGKRIKRLLAISDILSILDSSGFAEEIGKIRTFCSTLDAEQGKSEPINLSLVDDFGNSTNQRLDMLRTLNGLVTDQLNGTDTVYKSASLCAYQVIRAVEGAFPQLFGKDILFLFKGSTIARFLLLHLVENSNISPEDKRKCECIITDNFKVGDNDTSILINPKLKDFDNVFSTIVEIVKKELTSRADEFNKSNVIDLFPKIGDFNYSGENFSCKLGKRRHFSMATEDISSMETFGKRGHFYSTTKPTKYGLNHFTLCRIKICTKVKGMKYRPGAEFLDVSIPHKDDHLLDKYFDLYFSGKFSVPLSSVGISIDLED